MQTYKLGLDVGSTTVKLIIIDETGKILFSEYMRHFSDMRGVLADLFELASKECGSLSVTTAVTGSGGLTVSKLLKLPFVQEVVAGARATQTFIPEADVVLEFGGEDAKITYMKPTLEQRMNGTCAGGTGAFIDQMATLLNTTPMGLNELAADHSAIHQIASRCGVFAKSDIQSLLNDGVSKADIAVSIFQSVVNQTISGLACGRPIRGKVAFLGGPLHYLPELRERFRDTLHLTDESMIHPENSHLFVALGAALMAQGEEITVAELNERLKNAGDIAHETRRLPPLFATSADLEEFTARHSRSKATYKDLSTHFGPCYLGIDAGSTTIKAVLMDNDANILFTHYSGNQGSPLLAAVGILQKLYEQMPKSAHIAGACVTGYGEALIKEALTLDLGEVETIAHYRAAAYFNPDVEFIIDIGGQDMKALKIEDKVIDTIMLNEACSSGCGSFLETFAHSLGLDIQAFAAEALSAPNPVDLGTRCTVFMNSRVKQAQKEGASVGDISAGLSYSVVKNAIYKVIKIKDPEELGKQIVVQGGTFKNDAILRAFEMVLGRNVTRPDISGLMGAFGSALIARKKMAGKRSSAITPEGLANFSLQGKNRRCAGCENRCMLNVITFSDGRKFISGNRCEFGAGFEKRKDIPDLFEYKYNRTFDYVSLGQSAPLGKIGIPRCLNMYENYPFWHTLLTNLGFDVVLSGRSDRKLLALGMDTIPSDTVCYPAKLAHGHIMDLLKQGISTIFYPSIPYQPKEFQGANNRFNCPIVTSYPDTIKNNIDAIRSQGVRFLHPFFNLDNRKSVPGRVYEEFKRFGITKSQAEQAVDAAYAEQEKYKGDIRKKGEETLAWMKETGTRGIVLAGRPYHIDPEINHGVPSLITSYGMAVLTEDSVAHLGELVRPIRVLDQWAFHTRLYESAALVAKTPGLDMIQLNSFGCGLDAITTDQVEEIIEAAGKIYTVLKIDEINNLGAAKIRIRSLIAALEEKSFDSEKHKEAGHVFHRKMFTKEMREKHTLVCPQMAPIHWQFLPDAFNPTGYNFAVIEEVTKEDIDVGLKYVNNDACYPTIIVVGQIVNAFFKGDLDPDNTSVMLTQTGGGCRASNYIGFLRKALREAGFPQVPVVSINFSRMEPNPGFRFTLSFANRIMMAVLFGDLLMNVLLRTRPYEIKKGATNALYTEWVKKCSAIIQRTKKSEFKKAVRQIVADFEAIPIHDVRKPKVGIVGEILVKYHPVANNFAAETIEAEGGECVMPGLMDFGLYGFYNTRFSHTHLGASGLLWFGGRIGIKVIGSYRKYLIKVLSKSKRFYAPQQIEDVAKRAESVLSVGNCTGEGWLLTGEMLELIEMGAPNIICVQPFACLPNHVMGKGTIKEIRRLHPEANIIPVDYDPGASEVNQINRIKLMIYAAFENMNHGGKHGELAEHKKSDAAKALKVVNSTLNNTLK